jgi:hypothetical protein
MELKRPIYDAFLPPTACRKDTRERIDQIAKDNSTSAANIIRVAVDLFLQSYPQNLSVKTENISEPSAPTGH